MLLGAEVNTLGLSKCEPHHLLHLPSLSPRDNLEFDLHSRTEYVFEKWQKRQVAMLHKSPTRGNVAGIAEVRTERFNLPWPNSSAIIELLRTMTQESYRSRIVGKYISREVRLLRLQCCEKVVPQWNISMSASRLPIFPANQEIQLRFKHRPMFSCWWSFHIRRCGVQTQLYPVWH